MLMHAERQLGICMEVRRDGLLDIHADNGFAHTNYNDRNRKIVFEECSERYKLCFRISNKKIYDEHGNMEVCPRVYW